MTYTVIVTDISKWQDDNNTVRGVDFNAMRNAGAKGVIIRAGQGSTEDPDFRTNYAAAKAAGLARGVYWFFDSRTSPFAQGVNCAAIIGADYPELGTWLDLEENYGGAYLGWRNWINCLETLRTKLPRVGIYTAPYYWMLNRPQDAESLAYFKSFDLWIAHYGVTTPMIPAPWTGWVFWQFTSAGDGPHYGSESLEIDLNYFNGDEQTYKNYYDLAEIPTGGAMAQWYKVNTEKLNIRQGPGTSYLDIGDLFRGELVEADGSPIGGWVNIAQIRRLNGTIETPANGWCSTAYLLATTPPVVEPPAPVEIAIPDYLIAHFPDGTEKKYVPE